jgi:S1-C subfamily serine protease
MLTQLSNQFADAVAAAAPSVVQVHSGRRPVSGVIYSKELVLTTSRGAGHENGAQVRRHDGRSFDAVTIRRDAASGLALLRVPGLDSPSFTPSSEAVRVGHLAMALARSWSNAITASAGIVSVIGGPLRTGRRLAIEQIFRTTAPMHEGFSGGAFLDAAGGFIGITTAASIRGLGVVIPSSIAWTTAAALLELEHVKPAYLGIAGQTVTLPEHQRGATGRESGVLVMAVTPGAPAAQSGVLVGDVLLAVGDSQIASPDQLLDLMQTMAAGRSVTLHLLRAGAALDVKVTVAERPARS